ncbi:MAG: hydroxymyristoyl-ACP dehydratase [Rhodanobacteraceae bacterium]
MSTFSTPLRIEALHPALPGHFPGNPVVPGVVLLRCVADALRQWRGVRVHRFDAKFLAPLLAEQDARIELREDGTRVRFAVTRDDTILARGVLEPAA